MMSAQPKVNVTVSMAADTYERLAYYAAELDTKPSSLVRAMVVDGLDVAFRAGSDRASRYAADMARAKARMQKIAERVGE